jgi:hypothetical protein
MAAAHVWNVRRRSYAMNELLPIIRRKRRPLVVADASPVVLGKSVPDGPPSPGQAVATLPVEPVESERQPENTNAQVTPNRNAR